MTEDEAKKKWCPMLRISIGNGASCTNKGDMGSVADLTCMASACMLWRKEKDTYGDDYGKDVPDNEGFCGLGGKP